jgi:hypothetical protein
VKHLLIALVLLVAGSAHAQPVSGKANPDPQLSNGAIAVYVIAGDTSVAVAGVDVNLTVNGTARSARTNAEGRATFTDLTAGANVTASVAGDTGTVVSDSFQVPAQGGVRVLLSTKPMGEQPAEMGTMASGMPQPRQISGRPRPESADPGGKLTVRLTYDDFTDPTPPANHPVIVIGYHDDGNVVVKKVATDASGRAELKGLDVSGRTAYYAMTLLPRGNAVDRVMSGPIQMLPGIGMRLVLSGAKRTSSEPSIDDIARLEPQAPNVPAGTITVAVLAQRHDEGGTVELVDATSGKVIATERIAPADAADSDSAGRFGPFEPDPASAAGTIDIFALRGPQSGPLVKGTVKLVPAEVGLPAPPPTTTDENGRATFTGVAPGSYSVLLEDGGKSAQSPPITVSAENGGRVVGALTWFEGIPPRVIRMSSVPAVPDPVYVRLKMTGLNRKSLPFLPAPDHGTTAPFELGDRIRFGFNLNGSVDDRYLAVNGQISISNEWWEPYRAGDDGLVIPLPDGFTGAIVGEEDKLVSGEAYNGFRIRRPLAPGGMQFQAGFSLPIDDGVTYWSLDLPWGASKSAINLLDSPGMQVDLPAGASGGDATSKSGMKFFVISGIDIPPGQSISMTIRGLPVAPKWKLWLPRIAGLIVLGLIGLTIYLTVRARSLTPGTARATVSAKIQTLMDELVELERKGQGGRRKDVILGELEKLWEADGRIERARAP